YQIVPDGPYKTWYRITTCSELILTNMSHRGAIVRTRSKVSADIHDGLANRCNGAARTTRQAVTPATHGRHARRPRWISPICARGSSHRPGTFANPTVLNVATSSSSM